jgi:hypothetical protein
MKYLTIQPHQDEKQVLSMLKRELNSIIGLIATEAPHGLMGNQKILVLRNKTGLSIVCKIDGPGFLIDELYKKFI